MHVDEHDEVLLVMQQRRWQKHRCVGGLWMFMVASSVAVVRIYREDFPRVIVSCNRQGLSVNHILDTDS
jgi:hypothetical protein